MCVLLTQKFVDVFLSGAITLYDIYGCYSIWYLWLLLP